MALTLLSTAILAGDDTAATTVNVAGVELARGDYYYSGAKQSVAPSSGG